MSQIRLALFATLDLVGQGRAYDIFAGYWPHQNDAFADVFNRIPKYVVSRGNPDLSWSGSAHNRRGSGDRGAGAPAAARARHSGRQSEPRADPVARKTV